MATRSLANRCAQMSPELVEVIKAAEKAQQSGKPEDLDVFRNSCMPAELLALVRTALTVPDFVVIKSKPKPVSENKISAERKLLLLLADMIYFANDPGGRRLGSAEERHELVELVKSIPPNKNMDKPTTAWATKTVIAWRQRKINSLCRRTGYSKDTVAKSIGVSTATLNHYWHGRPMLSQAMEAKINTYLAG